MSIRQLALTALVVVSLAGCSSAAKTIAPASTAGVPTSAASVTPPTAADTSASTPKAAPVPGGGATDFCSAYKEYKTALEAGTPQAQGAAFRAASTDLRTFAPAKIKEAAGVMADVMDEVGQAIASGKANPGTLGSGQSEARRQGLADTVTWISKNCHF